MNSAPLIRSVDALTGQRPPGKFFEAMSEADNLCRELDGVKELRCRVDELVAENRELRLQLGRARAQRDAYRMSGDAR